MSEIVVHDDAIPAFLIRAANLSKQSLTYGWKSNPELGFGHWNHNFGNLRTDKDRDAIAASLPITLVPIWTQVNRLLGGMTLIRCYVNGHTFGAEGYPHTDSVEETDRTVVLYLNEEWKREWGGETAFYEGDEIVRSVMPRFGRCVIFPSNIVHCARAVSRICPVLRLCLVMKAKRA